MHGDDYMIEINKIDKYFGQIKILNNCSLTIKNGDFIEIVGAKGAGKSALMKMIAGFIKPDHGYVLIDHKLPYKQILNIGYVSKDINWYKNLTVEENILLSAKKHEISMDEAKYITTKILEFIQMTDMKNSLAGELSAEMKFKLSLAVIMVYKPMILLIEIPRELSSNKHFKDELWSLLEKINEYNITIIVSTSCLDKTKRCKKIVLMDKGKILLIDSWHNLKNKIEHENFLFKDLLSKLEDIT